MKKQVFRYLGRSANKLDYYRFRFKQRTGLLGQPRILPFRGFGNDTTAIIRGLVLEDKGHQTLPETANRWHNASALFKRYISSETPRVQLRAHFQGQHKTVQTDSEGYFYLSFNVNKLPKVTEPWDSVRLELLDKVTYDQGPVRSTGEILLSGQDNEVGVISDVDDTILVSRATNAYKKIRLMLFQNAQTRLPFEGVAAFYRALHRGYHQERFTPIFYVSSSSWKLYDMLEEFCHVQNIPKGPLLLRDSRLDRFRFMASLHEGHKLAQVKTIMQMYPQKSFILIGDSGQKDPEIYREVVYRYPERVKAIYIRDVCRPHRHEEIAAIRQELWNKAGVEMLLVKNTVEAAEHAASKQWIESNALPEIRGEQLKDQEAEDLVEA
ncbi:App1 family protein [Cesiribacter sp. SM1]|uniref:App1 family protein n=1 Tax=Cesiribacter sp. SM1 TaxID=2861196 RepID=UPI001CD413F9|nr:phosphatase domain-containing protein [Cesiribacter sp. SM1]